jgi:tetratricopeptide (TPR) repeat protein
MVIVTQRRLALLERQLGDPAAARRRLAELDLEPQDQAVFSAAERARSRAEMAWLDGDLPGARAGWLSELSEAGRDLDAQTQALVLLASAESALGHHDRALAAARTALDYFARRPGPGSLLHAQAQAAWAEALQQAGRSAEAAVSFQALLGWAEHRLAAPAGPVVLRLQGRALIGLSTLRLEADPEAALRLAQQAQAGRSARDAVLDDRLLWAAARVAQGRALKALGRRQEAADAASDAAAQLARDQVPHSPRLLQARALTAAG